MQAYAYIDCIYSYGLIWYVLVYLVCYSQTTECNDGWRTAIKHSYGTESVAQAGEKCCATGGGSWYQVKDPHWTCNPCSQGTYI